MTLDFPPYIKYDAPRVAFYGPMASGKTFAAENLFPQYHKEALAKPLKETARQYYGVTGKSNSERQILQELADDLKKWDNDTFTKQLLWRIYDSILNDLPIKTKIPVVIDDLRFTHEADYLKESGFLLVRVYVPEEVRMARISEKYPDTDPSRFEHRSEKDWKNITEDYLLLGEGIEPLESLREAIENRYA